MTEETGTRVGKIPAPTTTNVILIPPLGLERVVKLTDGFKAWWSKHGPQTKEAIIDAIAIIAEALKPTPPPAPPAPGNESSSSLSLPP